MWIYGRNAVLEAMRDAQVERVAVARGVQPGILKELRRAAAAADVPLDEVPRIQLDQVLKTTQHQGVAALLPEVRTVGIDAVFDRARERGEEVLVVLLDHLTDPRNVGAIIRSAEALGAHGVVMEERRSAPLTAVVVKAAAGATAHVPLAEMGRAAVELAFDDGATFDLERAHSVEGLSFGTHVVIRDSTATHRAGRDRG